MIATGNHNFERFAALCNTPEVEPGALRAGIYRPMNPLRYNPTVSSMSRHRAGQGTGVSVPGFVAALKKSCFLLFPVVQSTKTGASGGF